MIAHLFCFSYNFFSEIDASFLVCHNVVPAGYTMREVKCMKDEEKKPISWEMADPKPPVIQSGHMENRKK